MKEFLYIFLGGGLGSISRFLLSKWLNPLFTGFPLGTFLSNALSSVIVGIATGLILARGESLVFRYLVIIGFCGGFSTFSTFSNEGFQMLKSGNYINFIIYTLLSILICLSCIFIGFKLVQK